MSFGLPKLPGGTKSDKASKNLIAIYKIALKEPRQPKKLSLRPTKFGFKSPGSFALPEHNSGGRNE